MYSMLFSGKLKRSGYSIFYERGNEGLLAYKFLALELAHVQLSSRWHLSAWVSLAGAAPCLRSFPKAALPLKYSNLWLTKALSHPFKVDYQPPVFVVPKPVYGLKCDSVQYVECFFQIETNRNTALTLACFQGRHEVVSLLVDRKANIEHRAKVPFYWCLCLGQHLEKKACAWNVDVWEGFLCLAKCIWEQITGGVKGNLGGNDWLLNLKWLITERKISYISWFG